LSPVLMPASPQAAGVTYDNTHGPVDKVLLNFNEELVPDYDGDLVIGGHFHLPDQYSIPGISSLARDIETDKALLFVTLFDRSFSAAEVLSKQYRTQPGIVAQWVMDTNLAAAGGSHGIISGNPEREAGFYEEDAYGQLVYRDVYSNSSNADGLVIPYGSVLKIENGSFAVETTAIFDPFMSGISTLLYKVKEDEVSGLKKGFALHLCQAGPERNPETTYSDLASIPEFTIWLTCYDGSETWGTQVNAHYTLDCTTQVISAKQYKTILISVNRLTNKIDIYIDKVLKGSADIPQELSITTTSVPTTFLNELAYIPESRYTRLVDHPVTQEAVVNEVEILSNGINNTIQPVWRPDTTYAIQITTRDKVNGAVPPSGEHESHPSLPSFQPVELIEATYLTHKRSNGFQNLHP
ncbi:MAG TPA: hypothetical protein VGE58_03485, partial [Daejeonella sp.]